MSAPNPSRLDANQVLQGAYDEESGRLRTDSQATIVNADISVSLDAAEDSVESYTVDENGNPFTDLNYLPTGQSNHDNLNANVNLQVNNTDVSNANPVPVSVLTIPLPSGAATSALQTAGNSILSNININLDSIEGRVYNLSNYLIQDVEEIGETLYTGETLVNGTYLIKKITESGSITTVRYANISNNATKTTYADAWADKNSLNYTYLYILSNI